MAQVTYREGRGALMARQRMLHPGFFTDPDLAECSPLARILFEGLWCEADREGRLKDDPRELKVKYLAYDTCDARLLIDELERVGSVQRYEVDGIRLISLPNFPKYQHPHQREAASVLPAPPPKPRKGSAQPVPIPEKAVASRAESVTVVKSVTVTESVDPAPRKKRAVAAPEKSPEPGKTPDPRHAPLVKELCRVYEDVIGSKYPFSSSTDKSVGGRNAKAVTALLGMNLLETTIVAAWYRALKHTGFPTVRTLPELVPQMPHFVGKEARMGPSPNSGIIERDVRDCAVCGAPASADIGEGLPGCYPCIGKFQAWVDETGAPEPWKVAAEWVGQQRGAAA